jgi:hypothetical protein
MMYVNTQHPKPTKITSSEHWYIPATHAPAVYAFAELQVLTEHLDRVRAIDASPSLNDLAKTAALSEVVASAARRADDLTQKIRKSATPKVLELFEDIDVARSLPDRITFLPRVVWLLGALAALASVRSVASQTKVMATPASGVARDGFAVSLRHAIEDARVRWDNQADELLRRHPWVRGQHVQIELVDLETPQPRFRIPIRG